MSEIIDLERRRSPTIRQGEALRRVAQMLVDNARAEPWAKPLTEIVRVAESALAITRSTP